MTNPKDHDDPKKPLGEPRQQPVPKLHDHDEVEYERPLPQPGDKDYVAGQPVTEEEADATEKEVHQRAQDSDERYKEEQRAKHERERANEREAHKHQDKAQKDDRAHPGRK